MDRRPGRTLFWVLTVATIVVAGVWFAIVAYRARCRNAAVAVLAEVEHIEYLMPGGLPDGVGSLPTPVQVRVAEPVKFAASGPAWLRGWLGEPLCRYWLDTPVAVELADSFAGDEHIAGIRHLHGLKRLDLRNTKVSPAGLAVLRSLDSLEELRLGLFDAGEAGIDAVAELASLRLLQIAGPLDDWALEKLGRLSQLSHLEIESTNNAITDLGLANIAAMENLENLILTSSAITDAGIRNLSGARRLKTLTLYRMPGLSPEVLTTLKEKLPGLTVKYDPTGPEPLP